MGTLFDPSLMVTLASCLIAGCDAQKYCPPDTLGGTLRLTPLRRSVRQPGAPAGAILHQKGATELVSGRSTIAASNSDASEQKMEESRWSSYRSTARRSLSMATHRCRCSGTCAISWG